MHQRIKVLSLFLTLGGLREITDSLSSVCDCKSILSISRAMSSSLSSKSSTLPSSPFKLAFPVLPCFFRNRPSAECLRSIAALAAFSRLLLASANIVNGDTPLAFLEVLLKRSPGLLLS